MKLRILSLKGVEFDGEAESFNVKTESGEITILDHHRPLVTILKKGRSVITKMNKEKVYIDIKAGFLEMNKKNELKVLID